MLEYLPSANYFQLPYSDEKNHDQLIEVGNKVLELFNIDGKTQILSCDTKDAIMIERHFRHYWWINNMDKLRYAMHNCGMEIYDAVQNSDSNQKIVQGAWSKAEAIGHSSRWREQYQKLLDSNDKLSNDYLKLFFRISQQILSRALRWDAIFAHSEPTAYKYLFDLVVSKTLPLGFQNNIFYLQKISPKTKIPKSLLDNFLLQNRSDDRNHINYAFLCYEFKKEKDIQIIKAVLGEIGYNLEYGPLDEKKSPIEHQLAEKIINSSFVIAIVDDIDKDYGLPIWIVQEIDIAIKYNIPVILFTTSKHSFYLSKAINVVNTEVGGNDVLKKSLIKFSNWCSQIETNSSHKIKSY